MSRLVCVISAVDLMACRLNPHECCRMWTSNSAAVQRVLCVASANGACCS